MNTYEVVYDVDGEVSSAWIEASTPAEAQRRFLDQYAGAPALVLAVVRQ